MTRIVLGMNLESIVEQSLIAIGMLAIEGKVLPLASLRQAIEQFTCDPVVGYPAPDHELDALLGEVCACLYATGHVIRVTYNDQPFLAWNVGGTVSVSEESLN